MPFQGLMLVMLVSSLENDLHASRMFFLGGEYAIPSQGLFPPKILDFLLLGNLKHWENSVGSSITIGGHF